MVGAADSVARVVLVAETVVIAPSEVVEVAIVVEEGANEVDVSSPFLMTKAELVHVSQSAATSGLPVMRSAYDSSVNMPSSNKRASTHGYLEPEGAIGRQGRLIG